MKRFFMVSMLLLALSFPVSLFAGENVKSDGNTIASSKLEVSSSNLTTASQSEESTLQRILEKMPKISGYLQTGWNYSDAGSGSSSFQAKRLRFLVDGNVSNMISVRLQLECFNGISGSLNGNGQKNIQVMDAFATAKIAKEFQIRAGQYYLPIGYENYDISPATLETVDFSNVCYRMVCRNPISYNIVDYGRDLGVMLLGDLLPNTKEGFNYISYNLSLSNGSLPCKDDNNKSKDIVAALTVRPIKYLNFKGAYNWGEYAGTVNGKTYTYQPMSRYIVGAWYNDPTGLDLRAEYGHIQSKDNGSCIIKENGAYVLAGYHVGEFLPIIRYDIYRDKVNNTTTNNYNRILLGLTYQIDKNVKLQANYNYMKYTDETKEVLGKSGANQLQLMAIFKF